MANFNVPIISQKTAYMCWEACGHMMWDWMYRTNAAKKAQYAKTAGKFAKLNTGLTGNQCEPFYKQLGLRVLKNASGANVRHALRWSPVVFSSVSKATGHMLIATGNANGTYTIVNPCAIMAIDFDTTSGGTCEAGATNLSQTQVDKELGHHIWYW